MPAFVPSRVATYARVMAEEAERQQSGWKDADPVAIDREMEELTLAIFGRTLFGVDLRGESRALAEAIGTSIATVLAETVRFVHLPLWWPSAEHRRFARALRRLESTIDALVRERRAEPNGPENDLLSTLARQAGEDAMTDAEVRVELLNLVVAGFEATSASLAWTLDLLARDPGRTNAVQEETRAVLGGRPPTVDDLPKLPRAEHAFKEAMRLYPPGHIMVRQTSRPVESRGPRARCGRSGVRERLRNPQARRRVDGRRVVRPGALRRRGGRARRCPPFVLPVRRGAADLHRQPLRVARGSRRRRDPHAARRPDAPRSPPAPAGDRVRGEGAGAADGAGETRLKKRLRIPIASLPRAS